MQVSKVIWSLLCDPFITISELPKKNYWVIDNPGAGFKVAAAWP